MYLINNECPFVSQDLDLRDVFVSRGIAVYGLHTLKVSCEHDSDTQIHAPTLQREHFFKLSAFCDTDIGR